MAVFAKFLERQPGRRRAGRGVRLSLGVVPATGRLTDCGFGLDNDVARDARCRTADGVTFHRYASRVASLLVARGSDYGGGCC
ncbi:hypothetical protein ACIBO9_49605 [Streptomyces prunicolor]|uniref:hypothetical protein n=1 Tax=Streptomyces prunicolor TaxID=67348 RepID=UPI0037D7D769